MVCTFAGKHATAVRCYGKTMRQDKLQLKCKQKITISKPSSTTTNNLMALFGNVEVVSLPFTLLELARDGERGNGSHPIFFSLTRSVGSSHPWFSRSVLLLGLVCRLSLARHRIEHTQSTYRWCRNRQNIWMELVVGPNGNNNNDNARNGVGCECVFRNNLFNTKFIPYSCARTGGISEAAVAGQLPRSVKCNFHLSLLYCHLDGRQEIVLLVFVFFPPRRTRSCTGGQSVLYVFAHTMQA